MLCYRCGSHVQDGAEKCWNCGTQLAATKRQGASASELRNAQRTGSRVFGVVFKIGDLIANRYRVKDIAGSGGAGVVYRAHDQEIDVDVAVKVINAKLVQTADEQRLFSRQTKIAKKLSHQNVVRLYDEGRDDQRPYFTMQFLEGLSLRKIIDLRKEKKQTFALPEVEPIFNQLCQALDYAHRTTFHGNMKPDNVIVLPDLLKVTDFALLRGLPRKPFLAIQKSRGHNFRYLAPEVRLEVQDLEKSVDIYSLGVILSEMLTGVVYDDAKPEQLNIAVAGLDTGVLSVVRRAVARAPKDRYVSAAELYDDLRKCLTKGGVKSARPLGPQEHPANAAEAPTQRLDITKHGPRPIAEPEAPAAAPEAEERRRDARPTPVEVAASLSLGETQGRETTGTFDVIDDDMIESAAPAAHKSGAQAPLRPEAPELRAQAEPAPTRDLGAEPPLAASEAAPVPPPADEEDEETQAILEPEPLPATGEVVPEILEEISNSAIELIADPRATNVVFVEREGDPGQPAEERNRTLQPVPLPDSAIPEPAFAQAEATRQGRLDLGVEPTDAQKETLLEIGGGVQAVVAPASSAGKKGFSRPERPHIPRSPTLAMDPAEAANGATPPSQTPKRERPMTRPRMPTFAAAPMPSILPDAAAVGGASGVYRAPEASFGIQQPRPDPTSPGVTAIPIPPPAPPSNRGMYMTIGFSAAAVFLAVVLVVIVISQQQKAHSAQMEDLRNQILMMNTQASTARQAEKAASEDAERAGARAAEAARAVEEAEREAKLSQERKALAEAEAKRREDEARKLEETARASADERGRKEAERQAAVAVKAAEEQRRAADEAARKEREQQQRADAERKKKDAEEQARRNAERLAEQERESARKAEERAQRLAEQQARVAADREAKAETDARRKEAEARRREEEAARRKEAEAKKREDAERLADERRQAEAKKTESAALAAAAAAEPSCPKGMQMIPAGAFMAGSPRNDPERDFGDKDYESVDLPAFCVDYYEYPNGRGRPPAGKGSYKSAEQTCKKAGKRLCSEHEWEKACKGRAGTRYPYGNQWDPTACNTEDDEGNDRAVEKSGTFKKCRSDFNVYDLAGNVAEWTSTVEGSNYVVKGGSADRPGYDSRCAARKKKKATEVSEILGFRCCANASTP